METTTEDVEKTVETAPLASFMEILKERKSDETVRVAPIVKATGKISDVEKSARSVVDNSDAIAQVDESDVEDSVTTGSGVSAETTKTKEGGGEKKEVERLARDYGFLPEDVSEAGITTVAELNRFAGLQYKLAQRRLQHTLPSQSDAQPDGGEQKQPVRQEQQKEAEAEKAEEPDAVLAEEIARLEKDGYTELAAPLKIAQQVIAQEKASRKQLESRLGAIESEAQARTQAEQQRQQSEVQARGQRDVDTVLQTALALDPDGSLFGRDPDKRTQEQKNNLQTLLTAAYYTQVEQCEQTRQYVPMTAGYVSRSFNAAFANVIAKRNTDAKTARIKEQGRQKMGKAETRTSEDVKSYRYKGSKVDADSAIEIPALKEFFENAKRSQFSG